MDVCAFCFREYGILPEQEGGIWCDCPMDKLFKEGFPKAEKTKENKLKRTMAIAFNLP